MGATATRPDDLNSRREEVLALLNAIEDLRGAPTSIFYRLGLLLVAVAMVLLPLLYVALICLCVYGLYWHATENASVFQEVRGKIALLAYFGPLLIGGTLVLFLVKPLFAPKGKAPEPLRLNRKTEPLLFDVVERIAGLVGAPRPCEIMLDAEVNASARFRKGLLSAFASDLVLTIGTPLVRGLKFRQFCGVLAHEFGHFAQRGGMVLTYVIRSVNFWFLRVVYQRDGWDDKLVAASESTGGWLSLVFYLARAGVWLSRRVLWVLMIVGDIISSFMLRQMEYDADSFEVALAGSDDFEATMERIVVLSVATRGAEGDAGQSLQENGVIPDDWASLILLNEKRLPPEALEAFLAQTREEPTGLFDTHPSNADRVARAREAGAPSLLRTDADAEVLFDNLPELSKKVTVSLYRNSYGLRIKADMLQPVSAIAARHEEEEASNERMLRYFQGHFSPLRPLALNADVGGRTGPADQLVGALGKARTRLLELAGPLQKAGGKLGKWEEKFVKGLAGELLVKANVPFDKRAFGLAKASSSEAARVRREASAAVENTLDRFAAFDKAAKARLEKGLLLFNSSEAAEKIEDCKDRRKEMGRLFPALEATDRLLAPVDQLQAEFQALILFLQTAEDEEPDERFSTTLRNAMRRMRKSMESVREGLAGVDYPFEHKKGRIDLAAYALKRMPRSDEIGATIEACESLIRSVLDLRTRIFVKLSACAEAAETAFGLAPLPKPEEAEKEANE